MFLWASAHAFRKLSVFHVLRICGSVPGVDAVHVAAVDIMINGVVFVKFEQSYQARRAIRHLNAANSKRWGTLRAELASLKGYYLAIEHEDKLKGALHRTAPPQREPRMPDSRGQRPMHYGEDADAAPPRTPPRHGLSATPGRSGTPLTYESSDQRPFPPNF